MTKGDAPARPKLSADQVVAICSTLLPIGEKIYEYAQQMQLIGFEAFLPFEEFFLSFAESSEDITLHRQICIETAKTVFGTPWPPLHINAEYHRPFFKSQLLETLRAKRDEENGVPEVRLDTKYDLGESWWRRQIDPCQLQMARFQVSNREIYDARWASARSEMKSKVRNETIRFASGLSKSFKFDKSGRYAFFAKVMEREASGLGFRFDKYKSRSNFPVFSKALGREWSLCWTIEEPDQFFFSPLSGSFDSYLEIRHQTFRGSVKRAEPGEFLQIRHARAVPGFFNAYRPFDDLDELETLIKAHLSLYGLMAPIVEKGLRKILA